jgi:hypothetical protein
MEYCDTCAWTRPAAAKRAAAAAAGASVFFIFVVDTRWGMENEVGSDWSLRAAQRPKDSSNYKMAAYSVMQNRRVLNKTNDVNVERVSITATSSPNGNTARHARQQESSIGIRISLRRYDARPDVRRIRSMPRHCFEDRVE